MHNIIVYGASWCPPCLILKDWLEAGGLSTLATYEYMNVQRDFRDLDSMRLAIGQPTLGEAFPAVVILDNEGGLVDWKNGANQTWIASVITPDVSDSTTTDDTSLIVVENDPLGLGLDSEQYMYIGAALLLLITCFILSKIGWL